MQLKWGADSFAVNACDVSTAVRLVLSDSGRPLRAVQRASVRGVLEADGQLACTIAENQLRAALLVPYRDLILYTDFGTHSATKMINAESLSGNRIVEGPDFGNERGGAEYSTLRSFSFACEAEYAVSGTDALVLSFTETISITGTGGPVTRFRPAVNAAPVKQIIYPTSVIRATQSGQAVGHRAYPAVPPARWPAAELKDQRQTAGGSPRRVGDSYVEYPVSWAYVFESLVPLVGNPALPPR